MLIGYIMQKYIKKILHASDMHLTLVGQRDSLEFICVWRQFGESLITVYCEKYGGFLCER